MIVLSAHSLTGDVRGFAATVAGLLDRSPLPPVARWISPEGEGQGEQFSTAIAALPAAPAKGKANPLTLSFDLADGIGGSIILAKSPSGTPYCTLQLTARFTDKSTKADTAAFEKACVTLARGLMAEHALYGADLQAQGMGGRFLPAPPLAEAATKLAAADGALLKRLYDDPKAFELAGWRKIERNGDSVLFERGDGPGFGPDYIARIMEGQWQLARDARAGLTTYAEPVLLSGEDKIFHDGAARLEFVGYDEAEKLAEYSCALGPGMHIQGWEIFALRDIVAKKALPDGHAVATVRIVFMEESAARAEKRPLLDIGCRVFHYDADGELRELTD